MRVFKTYGQLQTALARDPAKSARAFRFLPEYMPAGFVCADCREIKPFKLGGGTGFGVRQIRCKVWSAGAAEPEESVTESMSCYACCSERERADLIASGKGVLYLCGTARFGLSADGKGLRVTDWPGGLVFPVRHSWQGKGGFGHKATYVRFTGPDGKEWSGRNVGDSEVCHVRRLKGGR